MSNKEVKYGGYSASPSDYECQDGDLAVSINLIPERGALRPVLPPARYISPPFGNCIHIHSSSAYSHYILRSGDSLYWFDAPVIDDDSKLPVLIGEESVVLIGSFPGLSDICAIGNTLVLLMPAGMRYLLWRQDECAYADLGTSVPFPIVRFALAHDSPWKEFNVSVEVPEGLRSYVAEHWAPHSGDGGRGPVGPSSRFRSSDVSQIVRLASDAVYAGLNSFIADAYDNCLFTEPFFIRYALRLFDGSYVMHSAPVLMIPNSSAPVLPYTVTSDSSKDGLFSADTKILHCSCSLLFQIVESSLADWKDVVTHIDFFVSPPVYTYDQSGDIRPFHHAQADDLDKFCHFGKSALSDSTRADDGGNHRHPADPVKDPQYVFSEGCRERWLSCASSMFWNVGRRKRSAVEDALASPQASLFYLVSSVEVGKVVPMDAFAPLDMEERSLRDVHTRPSLPDDYQSHHSLVPSLAHVYNARLNLAGVGLRPFAGFSIDAMSPFVSIPDDDVSDAIPYVRLFIRLRRNGVSVWVAASEMPQRIPAPLSEAYFPRWLFYPDSSAVEMVIAQYSAGRLTGYWRLPMSSHPSLEGSYWFRGLGKDIPDFVSPEGSDAPFSLPDGLPDVADGAVIPLPNKIYTSEVNNPFFFPLLGVNTIGAGRMLGICSAAKALSQGQFGQFPLYAFTSEGVWALEVSATGAYSARQPITRDVCINADGITQLDSAVLFPTDRGIMLISGSQTQCISDSINSEYPFDALSLLGFDRLHAMLGHVPASDTCLPTLPFSEFLRQCRMVYDYVNQRVIVYAPGVSYAYVFSLESKQWGMTFSSLDSHLNSYPEALAVDAAGNIVNVSQSSASEIKTLFLTRPLKLDAANVHKTIDSVIQRGLFRKGQVATALYGSRDLVGWHLVWSSRDHFLRGFRGTPFKYFRIAGVATLAREENVFGASVQFVPRLTNSPR